MEPSWNTTATARQHRNHLRLFRSGSIPRVSAPDVEELICKSLRQRTNADPKLVDRDLVLSFARKIVLSPKVVRSIVDGAAPADMTVSRLTQALPHEWSRQEETLGIR